MPSASRKSAPLRWLLKYGMIAPRLVMTAGVSWWLEHAQVCLMSDIVVFIVVASDNFVNNGFIRQQRRKKYTNRDTAITVTLSFTSTIPSPAAVDVL